MIKKTLPSDVEARYQSDMDFRVLVDTMESAIRNAQYTPSEMRQAAVLACIHYEQRSMWRKATPWMGDGE